MKVETKLFLYLVPFFVLMTVVYAYFTANGVHGAEWVGIVGLALTAMLCAFVGYYLWRTGVKLPMRPDDNEEGEIAEQAGEYGFFSPHSWWPLFLGAGAAICFMGVAVGWWMLIIGAPLACLALVGWVFEYFRGEHAV